MRWMQNLHHEILYADTYSKGEKLSERQFLWKKKRKGAVEN
jgi:hypothetical protein